MNLVKKIIFDNKEADKELSTAHTAIQLLFE